tara:strand:- start:2571 stop:2900 length:330 start_codon:yes stop_codon:yes gene_type:complete
MFRFQILDALFAQAQGNIAKAKVNIEIYLQAPVGIGEHPDILASIQEQVDIIAHEKERIEVLKEYFSKPMDPIPGGQDPLSPNPELMDHDHMGPEHDCGPDPLGMTPLS